MHEQQGLTKARLRLRPPVHALHRGDGTGGHDQLLVEHFPPPAAATASTTTSRATDRGTWRSRRRIPREASCRRRSASPTAWPRERRCGRRTRASPPSSSIPASSTTTSWPRPGEPAPRGRLRGRAHEGRAAGLFPRWSASARSGSTRSWRPRDRGPRLPPGRPRPRAGPPGTPVRVGRGPENDVVLFDSSVSRAHAVIESDASGGSSARPGEPQRRAPRAPRAMEAVVGTARRCAACSAAWRSRSTRLSGDDTLETAAEDVAGLRAAPHDRRPRPLRGLRRRGLAGDPVVEADFWSPWQQNRAVSLLQNTLGAAVGVPIAAFVLLGVLKAVGRRIRIADTLRAVAVVIAVAAACRRWRSSRTTRPPPPSTAGERAHLRSHDGLHGHLRCQLRRDSRRGGSGCCGPRRCRCSSWGWGPPPPGRPPDGYARRRPSRPDAARARRRSFRTIEPYLARVDEAAQAAAQAAESVRARQGPD